VIQDAVTKLAVKAIVSSDDVEGHMWTDAACEVRHAAGEDVQRQAVDSAPLIQGCAWITDAGALPLTEIVHIAAMDRRGETRLDIARVCIENALELARKRNLESLAISATGWGPRDIDLLDWLAVVADEAMKFLHKSWPADSPASHLSILLVLDDPQDFEVRVADLEQAVKDALAALHKPVGDPTAPAVSYSLERASERAKRT
jgi:O-acetyl-ADP-ribose deacetylase (regulator of RNase III)